MMQSVRNLRNLPARRADGHKGDYGHVLVVGGSPGMSGAACLAALGAQTAGSGRVTVALPRSLALVGELFRASIMSRALPENERGGMSLHAVPAIDRMVREADVCAMGPGLGRDPETAEAVEVCTREIDVPLVLDADALNALSGNKEALRDRPHPCVITPHPGEMARLAGLASAGEVQNNRIETAVAWARDCGVVTVLKGHQSLVTDGERLYVNGVGNPGMASGGMGDVLTGIVAALIGQGMECFDAAALGVFVHGRAGDLAASRRGMTSLTPEDVLEELATVFARLEEQPEAFEPDVV